MLTITSRDQVASIYRLPDCSLHPGTPAVVDGVTTTGQWAFLCPSCFAVFGLGLGMGMGQVLVPQEPPHHVGDMTAPCFSCGAHWTLVSTNHSKITHKHDCLYNQAVGLFPDLY